MIASKSFVYFTYYFNEDIVAIEFLQYKKVYNSL